MVEKLGSSSTRSRFPVRRTNMSPPSLFVKPVNTTYCGLLLGHSQDVDKNRQVGGHLSASRGAQADVRQVVFSPAGCVRKEVALLNSKRNATQFSAGLRRFSKFWTDDVSFWDPAAVSPMGSAVPTPSGRDWPPNLPYWPRSSAASTAALSARFLANNRFFSRIASSACSMNRLAVSYCVRAPAFSRR
jgi:hypothetical protein